MERDVKAWALVVHHLKQRDLKGALAGEGEGRGSDPKAPLAALMNQERPRITHQAVIKAEAKGSKGELGAG